MKVLLAIMQLALIVTAVIMLWDINFWWSLSGIVYLALMFGYIVGEIATENKYGK